MAWSEQEISTYQIHNNKMLEEINATLQPPDKNKLNIGIFAFGQQGDAMVCSSVLKYKDELWPDKNIIWFCNNPVADVFRYSRVVNEIRPWPWAGNGLPLNSPDYWPMLTTEDNRLNQTLKLNFEDTADISEGYFPCPFMLSVQKRHGMEYSNCSRKVFGIPDDYPWHPMLYFSKEEHIEAQKYFDGIKGKKNVIIETFAGSGQSLINEEMILAAMDLCSTQWEDCVFVFASHKFLRSEEQYPESILAKSHTTSCARFTVRQCALIAEKCDLMISVSSGITVAASAWGIKQPTTIQFCGSKICSTAAIANGRFELVTADNKTLDESKNEFMQTLSKLLNELK